MVSNYDNLKDIVFIKPLCPDFKRKAYCFRILEVLDYNDKILHSSYDFYVPVNLVVFIKNGNYYNIAVSSLAFKTLFQKQAANSSLKEFYIYPKEN